MKRTYPLEPVEKLREARADARALELSRFERRLLEARADEARARAALDASRAERREDERSARERLEAGLERAVDLEHSFVFSERLRAEESELEAKRLLVERRASEAEKARAGALSALATAQAELSLVERHHSQWSTVRAQEQQEKEQEAALEQWNSERSRRSGP